VQREKEEESRPVQPSKCEKPIVEEHKRRRGRATAETWRRRRRREGE